MLMKRLLLLVVFLPFDVHSQKQLSWTWLNPLPTGNSLTSVCFASSSRIVAVGQTGTILLSTNGGLNWSERFYAGPFYDYTDAAFVDSLHGVVSALGVVLRTTDGGNTWIDVSSGTGFGSYYDVFADSSGSLFVVGSDGVIFRSTNAGDDWTLLPSGTLNILFGIAFNGSGIGLAVGDYGIILRSSDGGDSWSDVTPAQSSPLFTSVDFANSQVAVAAGINGASFLSTDAGVTWSAIVSPQLGINTMEEVRFDGETGFMVGGYPFGDNCVVLKTTDGGGLWTNVLALVEPVRLSGLAVRSSDTCVVVGYSGRIFRTTDGGTDWDSLSSGTADGINGGWFPPGSFGLMAGNGGFLGRTTDSGATWIYPSSGSVQNLRDVAMSGPQTGYVVGDWATLLQTTDAGLTWTRRSMAPFVDTTTWFSSIGVQSFQQATIVGSGGSILHTADAGQTWSVQTFGSGEGFFNAVSYSDSMRGFAVGYEVVNLNLLSLMYRTTNGGVTWIHNAAMPPAALTGVKAIDSLWAFSVTETGAVFRTTDGGITWSNPVFLTSYALKGLDFTDRQTGFAVGESGRLFATTDGGDSWNNLTGRTRNTLNGVKMTDALTAYAYGHPGLVRLRILDPPTRVPEFDPEVPVFFAVFQNYPNPFNPSTRIPYVLDRPSLVTMEVFDVLGRKLETLFRKDQVPGTYSVDWDASRYPSGTYFCTVTTASGRRTIRMVLIR